MKCWKKMTTDWQPLYDYPHAYLHDYPCRQIFHCIDGQKYRMYHNLDSNHLVGVIEIHEHGRWRIHNEQQVVRPPTRHYVNFDAAVTGLFRISLRSVEDDENV